MKTTLPMMAIDACMTKKERDQLSDIVHDVENSDDKIWPLERLFNEVKRMIKY